ncbi:MAG: lipoyl(octanoyl) transferase LipB [Magnetococcales bacterium]|nr:lipoyl(octanoyl) transferase LipB [Magnetococcales bacterium]MBF0437842.1 lipoyl(octanoyl) transferase LipB [Magnetococcales bacterium]
MKFQYLRYDRLDYETALTLQKKRVEHILAGEAVNLFLLLEHDPVYTLGRSGLREDVLIDTIPVVQSDRGGKVTYHGPGQLVGYVVCDLRPNSHAVRQHVYKLEETVIRTLEGFGVQAEREADNPGVWVNGAKIGALGVRIRQGVAYHGFAVNHSPDLGAFGGIIPCGLPERPVTSLSQLGIPLLRSELEERIIAIFGQIFGVEWI